MQTHPPGTEPDEVIIKLRQSKTDQFRAGTTRNLFRGPEADFCPVRVLWALRGTHGGHGADQTAGVFTMPGGRVISRTLIAQVLREAATALGYPAARV